MLELQKQAKLKKHVIFSAQGAPPKNVCYFVPPILGITMPMKPLRTPEITNHIGCLNDLDALYFDKPDILSPSPAQLKIPNPKMMIFSERIELEAGPAYHYRLQV